MQSFLKQLLALLNMDTVKRRVQFSILFLHQNERVWWRTCSPRGPGDRKGGLTVGSISSPRLEIRLGGFLLAANPICGERMLTSAVVAKGSVNIWALLFSSHHWVSSSSSSKQQDSACSRSAFLGSLLVVTLDELFNFLETHFAHLCNRGEGSTYFTH